MSLHWRWWGEGWPVNMKRYTHYLSVRGWQHTGIMRYTHYHSGAKWTDAMGTVGESPWDLDWEWGPGPGDHRLLTTAARQKQYVSNRGEKIFPPSPPPSSHPFHTRKYLHSLSQAICMRFDGLIVSYIHNMQQHAHRGDLNLKFELRQEFRIPAKSLTIYCLRIY